MGDDMVKLDKIKKVELEILKYIKDFCEEREISYWLHAGTLLGAVRHKGFIPWDDDIDIGMTREDYNKFIKEFKSNADKKYFIEEARKKSKHKFIKIVSKNKKVEYEDKEYSIFVDIFPYDYYTKNQINFLNKFLALHKNRQRGIKNILKDAYIEIKRTIEYKILSKLVFKDKQTKKYIAYGMDVGFKLDLIKKDTIFPLTKLEYEGEYFSAPSDYDKYLTIGFGEYMKYPPVEERNPKHFWFAK